MKLKAISLFTGVGGLDLGFEAAGYDTAAAVEMDAACSRALRTNRPDWRLLEGDIDGVASSAILEAARLGQGDADVLIGGPPCQPFSKSGWWASGSSLRLDDPRAATVTAFLRVLRDTLPRAFLMENVEGFGFRGKDEGLRLVGAALDEINRERGTSYSIAARVLNAADFGVPQLRRRFFIVGSRDGTTFRFPSPTHADPTETPLLDARQPHVSAWDALRDVEPDPPADLRVKGKWADLLPSIPEGENYLWHTERGGGLPLFGWRRRFWSFLLKSAKDRPSWTIQAQPGPATGPFHWESRRFGVAELAAIQTFPKDLRFDGRLGEAHRQIGNAVPPLLAEVLSREIAVQLLGLPRSKLTDRPTLAIESAGTAPPPERVMPVPSKYLHLRGKHAPHPGTGKGSGASAREVLAVVSDREAA